MTLLFLIIAIFVVPAVAQAYLDPGAGSLLLQGALGAIAVAFAVVGTHWRRMRKYFARFRANDGDEAR